MVLRMAQYLQLVLQKPILLIIALYFLSASFSGCASSSPRHKALQKAALPELIPRSSFFEQQDITSSYQISPNGKKIAWLAWHHGNLTLFHKSIGSDKTQKINTSCWCNVSWFRWENDSRHLIYSLETGRKRATHIYRSDCQNPNRKPVNLTPDAKTWASLADKDIPGSDYVLISQDKRKRGSYDLYQIDLSSGDATMLAENNGDIVQWIADRRGELRGCIRAYYSNQRSLQEFLPKQKKWRTLGMWEPNEEIEFLGFTPDQKGLWLLSNRGRDKIALVRFDLETAAESPVIEDPVADIADVYINPATGEALFASCHPDYPKIYALDPTLDQDLAVFKKSSPVGISVLGMDLQAELWTVKAYDEKGASFYLYDRKRKQKTPIGQSQWTVADSMLSSTKPVQYKSRDNLTIHGYLTRPNGVANQPLPMVLLVHGGPWFRDFWGADHLVQFLANRGYAVLQINFRGSTGYGRTFMEAAIKEFGKKMHDDLVDAVSWAIDHKIAAPQSIAIVGGSYGGYAAMAGLTFSPDLFACAIAINGVSDLAELVEAWPSDPPLHLKRGYDIWYKYAGDPKNVGDRAAMLQSSPLYFANLVKKPILIIYGSKDRRVHPRHSIKMIEELESHHKSVTFMEIETEGHGIHWIHNSITMFREMEVFLAQHLGGRYQR